MPEATTAAQMITTNIVSVPPLTQLILMALGLIFIVETLVRIGMLIERRRKIKGISK